MPLPPHITPAALAALVRPLDPDAAHHVIWLDMQDRLHADAVPPGRTPAAARHDNWERAGFVFARYNADHIGPKAADDASAMQALWDRFDREY